MLFESRFLAAGPAWGRNYDSAPDGKRFVMVQAPESPATEVVVLNWFDELKRQTAAKP